MVVSNFYDVTKQSDKKITPLIRLKRRYVSAGVDTFDATWTNITPYLLQNGLGTINFGIDDQQYIAGITKISNVELTFDNTYGKFNNNSNTQSMWFDSVTSYYLENSLVNISFLGEYNNVVYTSNTEFEGLIKHAEVKYIDARASFLIVSKLDLLKELYTDSLFYNPWLKSSDCFQSLNEMKYNISTTFTNYGITYSAFVPNVNFIFNATVQNQNYMNFLTKLAEQSNSIWGLNKRDTMFFNFLGNSYTEGTGILPNDSNTVCVFNRFDNLLSTGVLGSQYFIVGDDLSPTYSSYNFSQVPPRLYLVDESATTDNLSITTINNKICLDLKAYQNKAIIANNKYFYNTSASGYMYSDPIINTNTQSYTYECMIKVEKSTYRGVASSVQNNSMSCTYQLFGVGRLDEYMGVYNTYNGGGAYSLSTCKLLARASVQHPVLMFQSDAKDNFYFACQDQSQTIGYKYSSRGNLPVSDWAYIAMSYNASTGSRSFYLDGELIYNIDNFSESTMDWAMTYGSMAFFCRPLCSDIFEGTTGSVWPWGGGEGQTTYTRVQSKQFQSRKSFYYSNIRISNICRTSAEIKNNTYSLFNNTNFFSITSYNFYNKTNNQNIYSIYGYEDGINRVANKVNFVNQIKDYKYKTVIHAQNSSFGGSLTSITFNIFNLEETNPNIFSFSSTDMSLLSINLNQAGYVSTYTTGYDLILWSDNNNNIQLKVNDAWCSAFYLTVTTGTEAFKISNNVSGEDTKGIIQGVNYQTPDSYLENTASSDIYGTRIMNFNNKDFTTNLSYTVALATSYLSYTSYPKARCSIDVPFLYEDFDLFKQVTINYTPILNDLSQPVGNINWTSKQFHILGLKNDYNSMKTSLRLREV
jgi:hypothetical protein